LVDSATSPTANGATLNSIDFQDPTLVSGRFGDALRFGPIVPEDATSFGRLDTPTFADGNTSLGNSFTISFWMKTADVTAITSSYVLQIGDAGSVQDAVIFGYNATKVELYAPASSHTTPDTIRANSVLSIDPLLDNTWVHVAYTFDGSILTGYINGVEANRKGLPGATFDATGGLSVGGSRNPDPGSAAYFAGSLDDIAIFRGALSGDQIAEIAGGSLSPADFGVSAVPEPSTYAAILGASALALVVLRRCRAVGRPVKI